MTRLGSLVATIGAAGTFGALVAGAPLLAVPFVLLVVAGIGPARGTRRVVLDSEWTAPAPLDGASPRVERRDAPSGRGVARALGRIEARELVLHPSFGVGIGLCAFMVVGFGLSGTAEDDWQEEFQLLSFLAHPLVGMAVLAAHAAATRSRRAGTDELFDACAATPSTRTLGALASMWVPPAVLAVFFALYVGSTAVSNPGLAGPTGPAVLHVASGLTLGAGGVALGVALGRWARFSLAPIVAVVVVGFVSLRLAESTSTHVEPSMVLSTFPPVGEGGARLTTGQMSWHVIWLLGLTAAVAAVAMVEPRRERSRRDATLVDVGAGA